MPTSRVKGHLRKNRKTGSYTRVKPHTRNYQVYKIIYKDGYSAYVRHPERYRGRSDIKSVTLIKNPNFLQRYGSYAD